MRPRLEALAAAVPVDARALADVGYDRGLLLDALLARRPALRAIGIERQPGAAARAAASGPRLRRALGHRLELRTGDGLAPLAPGEVDGVVIAGLDEAHIAAILRAHPEVVARLDWLLLGPSRFHGVLRPALDALGLYPAAEHLVVDRGRIYEQLLVRHGREPHSDPLACLFGPRLFERRDPLLAPHLAAVRQRFCAALGSGLAAYHASAPKGPLGAKLARLDEAIAVASRWALPPR